MEIYLTVQSLGQDAYDNDDDPTEQWGGERLLYVYDTQSDIGDRMKLDCQGNPVQPPEVDVSNVTVVALVTESNGDVVTCFPAYDYQ